MTVEGREGVRNIWATMLGQIARFFILLITVVVLPRLFGPEDYGRFSAVMAVISILFVVSVMGLRFAELRFLAPIFRKGDMHDASGLASSIFNVRLFSSLMAAVAGAVWVRFSGLGDDWIFPVGVGLFAITRYWLESARSLLLPLGRVNWHVGIDLWHLLLSLSALSIGYVQGGLAGALISAATASMLLFILSYQIAGKVLRITLGKIDTDKMRSVFPYCIYSLFSSFFSALQISLPIWILSIGGDLNQVAYLGVSVHILVSLQGMFGVAWQSLVPILSTFQDDGENERILQWINLLMRLSMALFAIITIGWATLGESVTILLFGEEYLSVYPCVSMMLLAVVGFFLGACNTGLVMLRKRLDINMFNYFIFTLSTMVGLFLLYSLGMINDAYRISQVYAGSALIFFIVSHVTLWLFEKQWMPLGRVLVLSLPVFMTPFFASLDIELPVRIAFGALFVVLYLSALVVLRLISWSEIRYAINLYRG